MFRIQSQSEGPELTHSLTSKQLLILDYMSQQNATKWSMVY